MYLYYLQEPLAPHLLDLFLQHGFYRMHQTLFTTRTISLGEQEHYPVYWLRIRLEGFKPDRRHRELSRRNSRFDLALYDSMVLNEEVEELYARYEKQMTFDAPGTAAAFLLGEQTINYFPSKTWQLRDDGLLIATGYFDTGEVSAAGILNFYDPSYSRDSIGTWLYFESIGYAAAAGMDYFYPGYIAIGYPKFDYKLLAGKDRIEVWDADSNAWISYAAAIATFLPII